MTDYRTLEVEKESETLGRINIDRPESMNALTPETLEELDAARAAFEADGETRAIVVAGNGDQFCAGDDVSGDLGGGDDPNRSGVEHARLGQEVFGNLRASDMPIVAAVDGYCLGGGLELTLGCDLRVASERSTFGLPEHDLGLMPSLGGTVRLQQLVGESVAKNLVFTAEHFPAERMYDWGFLAAVYDDDEFEAEAVAFAQRVADGPPIAQKYTKRAMHAAAADMDAGLEVEAHAAGHLLDTEDVAAGLAAFQSGGEPEFEGK